MTDTLARILGLTPPDPRDVAYREAYFPKLSEQVFREGVDCDRSDPRSVARVELLQALHFVFFGEHPDSRPPAARRCSNALWFLVKYLDDEQFPAAILNEIASLAQALEGLDRGVNNPLFEINQKPGNPVDPADIWELRAMVAAALDYLMNYQKMPAKSACFYIEKKFGMLGPVLTGQGSDFAKTVGSWRRKLRDKKVPHKVAQELFDGRLQIFAQLGEKGFKGRSIADKLLVDVTLWATRTSDDAMKQLYAEVERRARLNTPY